MFFNKIFHVFYSHVNYSVTKIVGVFDFSLQTFYSHVNYSVTKIIALKSIYTGGFTVT